MKNIIFIINTLEGGGAEKLLVSLLKKLNPLKNNIFLLVLEKKGIYIKEIEKLEKIKVYYLIDEKEEEKNKSIKKKIKKFIYCLLGGIIVKKKIKVNFDIGIAYLEGPSTFFLACLKNCKRKISWVHTDIEKNKVMNKILEKISFSKMDKIICVSNDVKKSVKNLYPSLKDKLSVIYNQVDKSEIKELAKLDSDDKIRKDKISLITIGRLNYAKGYDILLQAHNELLNDKIDYNLYILGIGEEEKKLKKYIKEKEITKNTFLLGFKKNPYPYIKQADIFISSSRYEGYPLVLCEALCLEKPIIATKCTGSIEILENGEYGLLSEVENVEGLKENIKKLVLDKELRKEYSILAKKRAEIFDIDKNIKELEKIFAE